MCLVGIEIFEIMRDFWDLWAVSGVSCLWVWARGLVSFHDSGRERWRVDLRSSVLMGGKWKD